MSIKHALLGHPVLTVVLFSLLAHLPGLTSPMLDYHAYRQCQTASMARNYVRHGMHFLQPELDNEGIPRRAGTEFPIYSYLLALLFKLAGFREIWGRLLSAVFAAWGAVYLYQLVDIRLGERIALYSALALCVLPIHLYFMRSVQPESMALWGILGFVYYWDRWLNRGGTSLDWVQAVLLGALAPLLKLPYLYVVFPLWLYLIWCARENLKGRLTSGLLSIAVMGVLIEAWYRYARTAPVTILPLTAREHWENLRPILTLKLWENHFVQRLPELSLTYPGILFAAVGACALKKQNKLGLWLVWFLVTCCYIVALGQYGQIHRYTELPFAPICAVFIGAGIAALQERWRTTGLRALLIILVLGMPLHAALRVGHWYKLEYPWVFRAREAMAQISRPEDLVITNTREHPVLLYYIDRYGFSPDLEESGLAVIDGLHAQGAAYFLTPTAESWSRHPEYKTYLDQRATLVVADPDFLIYKFR